MRIHRQIALTLACFLAHGNVHSQPLDNAAAASEKPPEALPPYRAVQPVPGPELRARIKRMRERLQALKQSDLSPEDKQAALDQLIREHDQILRQQSSHVDWQKPQTVDSVSLVLERMIFQQAAELAPTQQSREIVIRNAPEHFELDPNEPVVVEEYQPPLLRPVVAHGQRHAAQDISGVKEPESIKAKTPAVPAHSQTTSDSGETTPDASEKVQVAVLADDQTTTDMHDDNTQLRDVRDDKGQLLFFGKARVWIGGAVQLDAYWGDGLFTLAQDGDSDSKSYIRRAEGILRASVFENSEIKAQYDFDSNIFRNLYWRWISDSEVNSVTIGNQKEPLGLDYSMGSKFTTAMEPSAPSSAFGAFRSKGINYNAATSLKSEENPFKFWGDSRTFVTGTIGFYGEDIENSNDTDWAVTGRASMGGNKTENSGYHIGASASFRHGEYDRIAPRPGLQDVNRILLAQPDADTLAAAGIELMYNHGSLHGQAEFFYSDFSGGEIDATGWGGYGQVGWLFGGKRRMYRPNWGLWEPIDASGEQVFEVFARASLTHGNDEEQSSNDLALLTLGANWYYHRFRVSANVLRSETDRDLLDQSDGYALALRLQYLF